MRYSRIILFSLALWRVGAFAAEQMKPMDTAHRPVRVEDMRPHSFSSEGYSEQWSVGVWDDQGRFFMGIDALITNIGLGDGHGAFKVRYIEPSGRDLVCASEYSSDEWESSKEGFQLTFGTNRLGGDEKGLKISSRCDKFSLELELTNQAQPAFPGGGTARFGEEGVYAMLFLSPRSRAAGTITINGEERKLAGWAFAEHSYSNLGSYQTTSRWFRFKLINGNISIIMAEFESTADYGNGRSGWVMVADSNGLVLATSRVRFEFEQFVEESKEKGYPIPRRVRLVAADGDARLQGILTMTGLEKIDDPTANLSAVKRAVVRRFTKPRDYYLNCRYEFTIEKGGEKHQLTGDGVYRFMHVNPK